MQEKFSVVLEAVTNGFKSKMNEIKNVGEQTTVKMAELKREISALKSEMKYTDVGSSAFKEYAIAIDGAEKELKELTQSQKQVKRNSGIFDNMGSGFTKINGTIKQATSRMLRYGLSILSIRTAFSLVSKASQAYLSYDTDLANKLQSAWAGLGSFLAPIIEKIANMIMKLVGYMNIFIKAVTGQDLLAKASDKATASIKKQTKATKGLNKSLSDMDEITNISKDETSGVGGAEGMQNPFDNFKDVELPWADKIKKFGEWVRNNWAEVLAILGGTIFIIEGIKLALKGSEFATFGRILAGIGLTIISLYEAFKNFKEYLDLMNDGLENTEKGWKKFWDTIKLIGLAIVGIGITIGSIPAIVVGAIVAVVAIIGKYWEEIKGFAGKVKDWLLEFNQKLFGKTLGDIITAPFEDAIDMIIDLFDGLFKGIKNIADGIIKLFKGDIKAGFKSIGKGLGNVLIGAINSIIDTVNFTLIPMRAIIVGIGKLAGQKVSMKNIKIPKIPQLEVGTNYVPEDQLAYIHKGEAVVPKKFNSAEYFSNINNNEETNALLMDVNRNLIELIDKDTNLYINGKEFAQATYKDFKNEGNRLGTSSIVNVR